MAQKYGASLRSKRTALISFLTFLLLHSWPSAEAQSLEGWTQQLHIIGKASKYLQAIKLNPVEPETTFEITSDVIRVNLAVGETSAHAIMLISASDASTEFKIEQQYETSLTISAEGPHMDLVHWKHYLSPWSEIEKTGDLEFRSRQVFGNEFPMTSRTEIIEAARNELKLWSQQGFDAEENWIERAGQCDDPWTEPCGVGVSKVRLKIKVREAGDWKDIQMIEFVVPMGC